MNPFAFQADLARTWLEAAGNTARIAMSTWLSLGERTAEAMGVSPSRSPSMSLATPFSFPWLAAPMSAGMPSANPFAAFWQGAMTPAWPFVPGAAWWTGAPMGMTPPFGLGSAFGSASPHGLASPFGAPAFLAAAAMWPFASGANLMGTNLLGAGFPGANPLAAWTGYGARSSGAEIVEQVAASYRSASGYAVAAVIGPLGAALDPRTMGKPWWASFPARGRDW
ncbi:MAG: hypothetical protein AB7O57_01430 [Hyphomicrobiaceae bacterium]